MTKKIGIAVSAAAIATLSACAAVAPTPDYDALVAQMMKGSFRDQGIAKVDRLQQDLSDVECSRAQGQPLPEAKAKAIEEANLKTVKLPADGKFIGDWKEGEKLAQNGRGMTWSDRSASTDSNGGGCYNCHQISKAEISYGTIGPSLYNYGKLRGVSEPDQPGCQGNGRLHLGQALQRQGLQRLLRHAPVRPCRAAEREAAEGSDGAAAGPPLPGEPMIRLPLPEAHAAAAPRTGTASAGA